jgi:hypothetical protein
MLITSLPILPSFLPHGTTLGSHVGMHVALGRLLCTSGSNTCNARLDCSAKWQQVVNFGPSYAMESHVRVVAGRLHGSDNILQSTLSNKCDCPLLNSEIVPCKTSSHNVVV